jgi:hypothetical protein
MLFQSLFWVIPNVDLPFIEITDSVRRIEPDFLVGEIFFHLKYMRANRFLESMKLG